MLMESPVVRARELRRHDLLEEAARERLTRSALDSHVNGYTSPVRSSWISIVHQGLSNLAARLRQAPHTPGADDAVLASQ